MDKGKEEDKREGKEKNNWKGKLIGRQNSAKGIASRCFDAVRKKKLFAVHYFPHTEGAQYCKDEFHEVLDDGRIVHVLYLPIEEVMEEEKTVEVQEKDRREL